MYHSGTSLRFKIYFLMFLVVLGFWSYSLRNASPYGNTQTQDPKNTITISEQEFITLMTEGKIREMKVASEQMWIVGELADGKSFTTQKLGETTLESAGQYDAPLEYITVNSPMNRLWAVLFIFFLFFGGNYLISLTRKNNAIKRTAENQIVDNPIKDSLKDISSMQTQVHFSDVAGIDEVIEELAEVVAYLKDSTRFIKLGAKIPKGVLLYGLPGTGKTLVAKAVAGEAGVPFYSMSGSGFIEMYAGVGAARVRKLFATAKKNSPCIIFIDEIDALGKTRAGSFSGSEERDQTLNQLLVEMDGFDTLETIVLIGATNRMDILDPALLRPGRFDRHIAVQLPGFHGRLQILTLHTNNKPLAADVDLSSLAQKTQGLSGADLANLANEAALFAARHDQEIICMADFSAAIERVIAGSERKNYPLHEKEKKIIAYHESGHALSAKLLNNSMDQIQKISIVPRGNALGYVMQTPIEERHLRTRSELISSIIVRLSGRAAEEIVFNDSSTGAQNDLETASELATKMVWDYGMSEELGPLSIGKKETGTLGFTQRISPDMISKADSAVKRIIDESYTKAKDNLIKHREDLDKLASYLIEREVIETAELDEILGTSVA